MLKDLTRYATSRDAIMDIGARDWPCPRCGYGDIRAHNGSRNRHNGGSCWNIVI